MMCRMRRVPSKRSWKRLSTWYLRRSRRRFWKSESDSDKQAAYSTLYTALVTVAKLLAPAMPFLADELYQNLVRSVDETAPELVHLAQWPEVLPEMIDELLNRDMALGHASCLAGTFRPSKGKSQSPPASGRSRFLGWVIPSERKAVETYADLFMDELNVKQVRLLDAATEAVSHSVKPLPKQLGTEVWE